MRIRETIVAAGFLSIFVGVLLAPRGSGTDQWSPHRPARRHVGHGVERTMIVGAGIVTLMPRVFYNDPSASRSA